MAPMFGVPRQAPPRNGTQDEMLRPVPWFTKMDSRPKPASSRFVWIQSHIWSSASSHVQRSHASPLPRSSFARLMGYTTRDGLYT